METNFWQGSKVRLRAVEPGDWETFRHWDEDSEVARSSYLIPFPSPQEASQRWTGEVSMLQAQNDIFRWVITTLDGEAVGTLNTHSCDHRNGTFQYGVAIVRQHMRKGFGSEAVRMVLQFYFDELRYQKVNVHIYSFNEASLSMHERLGFVREGLLRRMMYTDGVYYDEIVLGMTAEEFRQKQLQVHVSEFKASKNQDQPLRPALGEPGSQQDQPLRPAPDIDFKHLPV